MNSLRARHRPPTLVSMWMLDVFCCALGCVTLLWLMNNRAAQDQAEKTRATQQDLTTLMVELFNTHQELEQTQIRYTVEVEELKARLLATTSEREQLADKLAVARTDIASLQTKLSRSDSQNQKLIDELIKKQKTTDDLSQQLASMTVSADELRRLMREKQTESQSLALRARKAEEQLNDLDAKLKSVTREANTATADRAALRKSADELAAATATVKQLQKQLDDANANIIDLQGEKKKLADTYDRLRIQSEAKFAGIAMTGKRVCFVIDISGSMKLLDDKTPAPQKWPLVVETVTKVMRTLPELSQFQIVIFSRQARFLFEDGQWQEFRGEETLQRVRDVLLKVDPVGDTNMYQAFETAFRLRSSGLDTIYFFSDGLPTSGTGLTELQEKTFSESQRTEALAKHIRQTLNAQWNIARGGQRVRINAIGFFFESPEVGAFLWALSRENDGSFVGMSRP